jgi:hypothetical protein
MGVRSWMMACCSWLLPGFRATKLRGEVRAGSGSFVRVSRTGGGVGPCVLMWWSTSVHVFR